MHGGGLPAYLIGIIVAAVVVCLLLLLLTLCLVRRRRRDRHHDNQAASNDAKVSDLLTDRFVCCRVEMPDCAVLRAAVLDDDDGSQRQRRSGVGGTV